MPSGSANPKGADLFAPRKPSERIIGSVLMACALISIFVTVGIVLVLAVQSAGFFREVSLTKFLGEKEWTPLFANAHFGIWPLVCGTLITSAIAILFALPLGLLAAIYLSEFATERTRKLLKPLLEVLAGIPTVVYGYFALTFVSPMLQKVVPGMGTFNALSAGLVMGVMIIPIIASLSEDAIYAVPPSLREGAFALGAGKLKTVFKVVVPAAFSGIAASVLLGVSRAIGETMIVAVAAGQQPQFTFDPRQAIQTMTAYIVQVSKGDTPTGTLAYHTIFAVGLSLFVMTLIINIFAHRMKQRVLKGAG